MAKIRYGETAVYDKVIAERTIRDFFIRKQSRELVDKHVETFLRELERHENLLVNNPKLYQVRFFSPSTGRPIRSSKSDFSDILFMI